MIETICGKIEGLDRGEYVEYGRSRFLWRSGIMAVLLWEAMAVK